MTNHAETYEDNPKTKTTDNYDKITNMVGLTNLSEIAPKTVLYGAQSSATKNLHFIPWNSRKELKFHTQLASAFSLHM